MSNVGVRLAIAGFLLSGACAVGPEPVVDAGPEEDVFAKADIEPSSALCPAGYATLSFSVDDTANKTYQDGELIWTGSFEWDEATNELTYATSWLPEEGPYPPLFDDGPRSAGGHEAEGASAGDHVFGTSVCYLADEDKLLAYGVLNDQLRWIWIGPNGQIEIKADTTETVDVPGMAIAAHGALDFRVELDMAALHENFATSSLDTHRVFIKGTMNSWTPVQLLDNGKLGDAEAGDGKVTYLHSSFLGPHDGLLNAGQEAQFVFVVAKDGISADDGPEYKDAGGDAATQGISAFADCGSGWEPTDVNLSLDSKGKSLNTTIVVCGTEVECSEELPCEEGFSCVDGACVSDTLLPPQLFLVVPNTGSSEGGTEVTLHGENLTLDALVTFDDLPGTVMEGGGTELVVATPAHAPGVVDVKVETSAGEALFPDAFHYVEAGSEPKITSIEPNQGSSGGGTAVTITGSNFAQDAVVSFGTAPAAEVSVSEDGTQIMLSTPAHPAGIVPVKVSHGDGQVTTLVDGFTYTEKVADWGQLEGEATVSVTAGDEVQLLGQVYEGGVTDSPGAGFGLSAEVGWGPAGSDPTTDEGWSWSAAEYLSEVGNNDRWAGVVTVQEGSWRATMRFSLNGGTSWLYVDLNGDDDGFQADNVLQITADAGGAVNITSLTPGTVPVFGGATITLVGTGFEASCVLRVDGKEQDVTIVSSELAEFVAPPQGVGPKTVLMECTDASDSMTLVYTADWDGSLGEWPAESKLDTAFDESDWGPENTLTGLWAAVDAENLYIGIEGTAMGAEFGPNAILVYVDVDLGDGTGLDDMSGLENEGAVDDALGGSLKLNVPGFGAEVAFATLNMASYDGQDELGPKGDAGWRGLDPVFDLPWLLEGSVFASGTGLEAILPLNLLYGPPAGLARKLGLVVRLGNKDGMSHSNQTLPAPSAEAAPLSFSY